MRKDLAGEEGTAVREETARAQEWPCDEVTRGVRCGWRVMGGGGKKSPGDEPGPDFKGLRCQIEVSVAYVDRGIHRGQ